MEDEPAEVSQRGMKMGVQRRYSTTVAGVALRLTVILAPRARLCECGPDADVFQLE